MATRLSSGTPAAGTDTGTLSGFTAVSHIPTQMIQITDVSQQSTFKSASIMAASAVGAYVQANSGVGIVN